MNPADALYGSADFVEYMPLAKKLARRYDVQGMEPQDMEQEAYLSLHVSLMVRDPIRYPDLEKYLKDRIRSHMSHRCRDMRQRSMLTVPLSQLVADQEYRDQWGDGQDTGLEAVDKDPLPEQNAMSNELLARIKDWLSLTEFKIMELVYWFGESDARIAKALGITDASVYTLKCRAKVKLRELLIDPLHDKQPSKTTEAVSV